MGGRSIPREILIGRAAAVFLDLDGTLLSETGPIPGAAAALDALRRRGVPFRILTNTSRMSRRSVLERLERHSLDVREDELFTAVSAGVAWLERRGIATIAPLVSKDALEDLAAFDLMGGTSGRRVSGRPEAVVVGDLGNRWSHTLLNEALRYLLNGARLVALHRGRYWLGPTGLEVDAGAYVAALEFAASIETVVCGKPNAEFFRAVVESLGRQTAGRADGPGDDAPIVMIGDDIVNDVQGAQAAGMVGWLVKTGKFRAEDLERDDIRPERVLDSVADLADGEE